MYGHSEHAYNVTRIQDVGRSLGHYQDVIRAIRVDILEDAPTDGQAARDELRKASRLLTEALKACDKAVALLPTPVA